MNSCLDPDILKPVSALAQPFQSVFNFRYFNSLQSECFSDTFLSDINMVISAPTGSGKTVLFELCILRLLSRYLTSEGKLSFIPGCLKTIYIAPSKALVQEKLRYWKQKFGQSLCVKCLELTGDSEAHNARDIQETDIILTTPEKFDSVTRRCINNGGLSFFGDIALVLIDEVHLLSDPRGAALEAIISRIKMISHNPEMVRCPLANVRFVAVSATIPNIEDLAEWLMVPNQGMKRFGEEMRPVKLTRRVYGYAPAKNDFLFERMCGRAGRPQFDDSGLVIIMTRKETVHLYENLLSGCEMVESELLSSITEHLNAEIVQLTVSDISLAIEWLKCSFLYVRIRQNPKHYGVQKGIISEQLEKRMKEICVQSVNELAQHGMVSTDEYGFILKPLEPGRLMAKYYLRFDTMKVIMKTPEKCSLEGLLHIIAQSEELAWIKLRRSEKKLLNDINFDKNGRLRFHILSTNGKIKKRIQTREEKIFVLANDSLSGDPLVHDLTLNQDVNAICSNGSRIARCMSECFIFQKRYLEALNSMILAKSLRQRLWEDSPFQLKQLLGVGMVTAKALHLSGINSFESMENADPRRIEILTGRKYPFGNHIKESLLSLPPKMDIKIEEIDHSRQGKVKLMVTLTRLSTSSPPSKRHFADLVVGNEEDNQILFHEKIRLDEFSSPYTVTVYISNVQDKPSTIEVDLVSEEYVGVDIHMKYGSNKQASAKQHNYKTVQESNTMEIQSRGRKCTPKKKEEKLNLSPFSTNFCSADIGNIVVESMPTFNLLPEEKNISDGEDYAANDPTIDLFEDERKRKENISGDRIFDHIRRKAKSLPSFEPCQDFSSPNLHGICMLPLPPCDSNKTTRLKRENEYSSDLTPAMKRIKEDEIHKGKFGTVTGTFNLEAITSTATRVKVCNEANHTAPNFSMGNPHSLSSETHGAHLDNNFAADATSVITIEDSQTAEGDTEISVSISSLDDLNNSRSGQGMCEPKFSGFSSLGRELNNTRLNLECKSQKLNSHKGHLCTSTSAATSMMTPYGSPQQNFSISSNFHRSPETKDNSCILFLTKENGESSFLGCQSVFSFL